MSLRSEERGYARSTPASTVLRGSGLLGLTEYAGLFQTLERAVPVVIREFGGKRLQLGFDLVTVPGLDLGLNGFMESVAADFQVQGLSVGHLTEVDVLTLVQWDEVLKFTKYAQSTTFCLTRLNRCTRSLGRVCGHVCHPNQKISESMYRRKIV